MVKRGIRELRKSPKGFMLSLGCPSCNNQMEPEAENKDNPLHKVVGLRCDNCRKYYVLVVDLWRNDSDKREMHESRNAYF